MAETQPGTPPVTIETGHPGNGALASVEVATATNGVASETPAAAGPAGTAPAAVPAGLWSYLSALLEPAFYVLLGVISAALRLWDLGPRAYHHDESLHAYYSWVLYTGGGFMHNPLMHGPFLFDITALGFYLFGDNLAAPRVFAALFGVALVLMPFFLRDRLGKWGAMAAALLIATSPSLFYFSRFIREDIFTLVFELGAVICLWRYIDTRKNRYIYLLAASLALLFSTKETSYITTAILVSFLFIWWTARRLAPAAEQPASGGPPWLRRFELSRQEPRLGLVIVMATLVLPLAAALVGFLIQTLLNGPVLVNDANSWHLGAVGVPVGGRVAMAIAASIALVLFAVSAIIGLAWRQGIWLLAFATFWGIFFFLHTTFLTNMIGVGTGVWQGLGYWIAQQSVERGSQPWYYYFLLLPVYETLALSLALAAFGSALGRLGRGLALWFLLIGVFAFILAASIYLVTETKALYGPVAIAVVLMTWLALRRGADAFDWFLIYWTAMNLVLFIVAGEKMPWLVTHLVLPMTLLGGRWAARALSGIQWRPSMAAGGFLLLALAPVLVLVVRAMVLSAQWERSPIGIWSFLGPLLFTAGVSILCAWLFTRVGPRNFAKLAGLSLVAVLGFFSLRTGYQAAFTNADVPRDMLVYTQTSPEIAGVMENIDRLAVETGKGADLPIFIDTADGFAWPWYWYLRNYKHVTYMELTSAPTAFDHDVVVINARNTTAIFNDLPKYTEGQTVPFRQWFPESYRGYTLGRLWSDLFSTDAWSRLLNFYTYKRLGEPLGHIDSVVYYNRSLPGGGR